LAFTNPMNFYLNQVLKAFSEMDAQQIGELLDSQYTYQEVPLEIFIEKLEVVFEEFKKEGDTRLEILPGTCSNFYCNPDYIRTAYRFVGDQTRNYLDFRFLLELTDNKQDHTILDIFHCNSLNCQVQKDWYAEPKFLKIHWNEKSDFKVDPDEILHSELALEAVQFLPLTPEFLSFEELNAWLLKYFPTFDFFVNSSMDYPFYETMSWDEFAQKYDRLNGCYKCVSTLEKNGYLDNRKKMHDLPEKALIEKVCEIENILIDGPLDEFFNDLNEEADYQMIIQETKLGGEIFDKLKRFLVWFNLLQKQLVQKYYALTESQTDEFIEAEDYLDPELTLKLLFFHMEIRSKAKARGEYIPVGFIDIDLSNL